MLFCGNGTKISEPWQHKGFTPCFLDTTTASTCFGIVAVFGIFQMMIYRKYSTPIDKRFQPHSFLYSVQIFLSFCLSVEAVTRVVLYATVIGTKKLFIYQVPLFSHFSFSICLFMSIAKSVAVYHVCMQYQGTNKGLDFWGDCPPLEIF